LGGTDHAKERRTLTRRLHRARWDLLVVLPDDAPEGDIDPLLAWQLQKGSASMPT